MDPDLKAYLDNFLIICNDPENNDAAEQLIQKAKSPDPMEFRLFLEYNIYIFRNPQHVSALYYSSILIMNAFRTSSPDEIKEKWFSPQVIDIQQDFKNTIITGIQNENLSIRNVCSTIIASIAFIESTWADLCGMLVNNIKGGQDFNLVLGSIRCLAELFTLPVINPNIPLPAFMLELLMILVHAIKEENLPVPSRIDACQAFIKVSEQIPLAYDPDFIDIVVQCISKSLMVDDLYLYLFNILIGLVKKNYINLKQQDDHIISNIKDIIHNEIQNKTGYFKCVATDFLGQFADFEKNNPEPKYEFSCSIATEFVGQLLQCLIDIEDPKNENPEDPLAITPQITAANVLQSLFYHNMQVIFENVKAFFQKYIGSQRWVEVHAAIYSIYALCKQSNELDGNYNPTVKEFIDSIFPLIIIHAGENAMCLRTKETALWIISSIIESYPMIDQDTDDEEFSQLLSLFENSMVPTYPTSIITRACKIFKDIAVRCNSSYLDSNYQEIVKIILTIIQNIQPSIKPDDAIKPFAALDALIKNCPNSCDQQIFELLNDLIGFLQNESCPPLLAAPICLSICTIILKIPNIISPIAESLLNPFIKLIDVTTQEPSTFQANGVEFDLEIWDFAFHVIANLIDLRAITNNGILLIIVNSIFNALYCGDIRLTKTTLKVLGKLYFNVPPEAMEQYLDKTLAIITHLITSVFIESDLQFTSSVIFIYANIFERMGSTYIHFNTNADHNEVLQRINIAWRSNLESEDLQEVFKLYTNIAYAYKCLVDGFADDSPFLVMECKRNIFKFIEMISVRGLYNDDVLEKIYDLLKVIAKTLKTKINVLMNRAYVLEIVRAGLENRKPRIAEKAAYLHKKIPKM